MRTSLANDREIFDFFRRHESLSRLRGSFDLLLDHPVWWIAFKPNGSHLALQKQIEASGEIWHDPRVKKFAFTSQLYSVLKKRSKETRPFLFSAPKSNTNFCVPLLVQDRLIGYFGLSGLKKDARRETFSMLTESLYLILDNCAKKEELGRLSATIRPRAIALSTVHTVHRIINSTLNLDELISRLAHLTAQVLRANRCSIYLMEEKAKPHTAASPIRGPKQVSPRLVCRAMVGYAEHKHKGALSAVGGKATELFVAKTARTILRKKLICIPLIDEDIIGVVTVSQKKDGKEFTYFDQEILTTLAEEAVIAIKNAQLYEEQKKVTLGTIQSLAVILGTRVPTIKSPEIFLRLALQMARDLKLSEEDTQALHYATLLKDTAKIGIPDEILKKPAKLTGEEYRILREHPIKGAKIVQSFESLKGVVPIILYSREKYDGSGYPRGLKAERIPIGARILSVITAFEAIIIGRPYRDRVSLRDAVDEIMKNSGTQFDPRVVEAFVKITGKDGFDKVLKNA